MQALKLIIPFLLLFSLACSEDSEPMSEVEPDPGTTDSLSGLEVVIGFQEDYTQLPEKAVAVSQDKKTYAQYALPTERYSHGIMGDAIEAGQLVVYQDEKFYAHTLSEEYVFEDIRPRLFDVDNDSVLEFICIRTHVNRGAGIAMYKVINDKLIEYAKVEEIGIPNRWLNIATISDWDQDGIVDIAWVQTPHIGGILKVATIEAGTLTVRDEQRQYSNHAIGQTNLCLSVLSEKTGQRILYLPNQARNKIFGFSYAEGKISIFEEIEQEVDFSKKLEDQYEFENIISGEDNCIAP